MLCRVPATHIRSRSKFTQCMYGRQTISTTFQANLRYHVSWGVLCFTFSHWFQSLGSILAFTLPAFWLLPVVVHPLPNVYWSSMDGHFVRTQFAAFSCVHGWQLLGSNFLVFSTIDHHGNGVWFSVQLTLFSPCVCVCVYVGRKEFNYKTTLCFVMSESVQYCGQQAALYVCAYVVSLFKQNHLNISFPPLQTPPLKGSSVSAVHTRTSIEGLNQEVSSALEGKQIMPVSL